MFKTFILIKQNKYLKEQNKVLKKLFNKYSKNRKKLIFVLLVLAIYNIIAIVEVFSFVKNYLDFF